MQFETIIGLEVHTQLNTKTKIFCSCATSFGEEANANTCPVCLALPGALPVLNKEALRKAISFGKAVGATVHQKSIFNRKNYFYPDLPKAYQISQFDIPIVEGGSLEIDTAAGKKRIGITRAHLEEDAGKNVHEEGFSKVDLNRAGTPLLEIVSEPEIRGAEEAVSYLKKLHSTIRFLGISDANMQEGSFRCDVNISIRPAGDEKLYTRVEIKNLNSFRFIQKAIEYEEQRQIAAWMDGTYEREVVQETRLFDTNRLVTKSMRSKEEAAEYRYFADPDLLPVWADDELMATPVPELADAKCARYESELGVKPQDASVLTSSLEMAEFFEYLIAAGCSAKMAVTWLSVELLGALKGELNITNSPVSKEKLAELIKAIESGKISNKAGKEVLAHLLEHADASVESAITELGLAQVSDDGAIKQVIEKVLAANADKVAEYKAGKDKMFGFFVGQVMKEGKGAFNPAVVNELLKGALA